MRVKKKRYEGGSHVETVIFVYSGGKLVEEFSTAPPQSPKTKYMTEDHIGTPRVITDGIGQVVSRRDFMPFGEDIDSTIGTRDTSSFKYSTTEDDVRQKFTGYQQDKETGLDFAEARMYNNQHARFTAVDPLLASGKNANPQTFNRYVYVMNKPFIHVDRDGKYPTEIHTDLINAAFSGLSDRQRNFIIWGSASVDTRGGSGTFFTFGNNENIPTGIRHKSVGFDIPSTLNPNKAAEHAMIPEGKNKVDAIKMADDFIEKNMKSALSAQREIDSSGRNISLKALFDFGRAQHTMMDSISPAHRIYQPYDLETTGSNPLWFGLSVFRDAMGLMHHSSQESSITPMDRADAIMTMRAHMLTVFGLNIFNQAVPENERQAVINYVERRGFKYNKLFGWIPTSWNIVNRATNSGGEATADPPATTLDEQERRRIAMPLPGPTP